MLPTVPVAPKRLDDYVEPAGEEAVERLREAARPLTGAKILHLNSTGFGGGVAELLHTQVGLLQDLGIRPTWAVLEGSDDYFAVTKAMHNALQGAEVAWTREMERTYRERISANATAIDERFDFVFIHDPQPAAVIEVIESQGRRHGKWIWRCHLDMSDPFGPVWDFFRPIVFRFDAAIFTMERFAQAGIDVPLLTFIPPSIDPLSTKNCPMGGTTIHEVLTRFGIDQRRPTVIQVSRFDPWKDPMGVIDAFRLAREEVPDAQLVMAGSMAHDDPEGMQFLGLTERHRGDDPDIHLLTEMQGVGNLEVNALQRASQVVVQKSTREGFGLVVSEGMWKEKPIVGGNVGGIALQIEEGRTGYLVDSIEGCAARITDLLRDPGLRASIGRSGRERVRERFLSPRELEDHLRLLARLS